MNGENNFDLNKIIHLTMKTLNKSEEEFLDSLLNGLNNQITTVNRWLNSKKAQQLFKDKPEDVIEYLEDAGLIDELEEIIDDNTDESDDYVATFFYLGQEVAYNQLTNPIENTVADITALNILTNYTHELIDDINHELLDGIIGAVSVGVLGGLAISEVIEKIINLPSTPIDSQVSVETRTVMSAVTEYTRGVNTGTLQTYSNNGVKLVDIITAGDDLVCDDCLDLEANNPYTLSEVTGLIPCHPNCRCGVYLIESSEDNPSNPEIIDLT